MLAKAACVSIHTLALVLSIRPPASSTTKEKADKVKDEGLFTTIMINLMPRFGQSAAVVAAAAYILCMSRGVIPGELKTWQVATTVSGVLGYALRVWSFRTLNRFFTVSQPLTRTKSMPLSFRSCSDRFCSLVFNDITTYRSSP